jgi:hypothetical protein
MTTDVELLYATKSLPQGTVLQLGELLRSVPELIEDLRNAGWETPYVVHVPSYSFRTKTGPPPTMERRMTLRHGHDAATKNLILSRHGTRLRTFELVEDRLDTLRYQGRTNDVQSLPAMRMDIFGESYFDLNQTRLDLAEPVINLVSLFILSSAARYEPGQWQRLLESRPAEAILVDRLLDLGIRKIPNLVLNTLHDEIFRFRLSPAEPLRL